MAAIPVIENPRRRLTAKQLRAGFGGKRRMSGRSRRRNPALATLAANPRRKRRQSSGFAVKHVITRRRRRNPQLFGMFDLQGAAWTAGGAIGVKVLPGIVQKMWPALPVAGPMGYAVKIGTAAALGFGVKMFAGENRARQVVNGALAAVFVDAFNEFVGPKLGLSGLSGYVTDEELRAMGLRGYVPTPTMLERGETFQYPAAPFPTPLMAQ